MGGMASTIGQGVGHAASDTFAVGNAIQGNRAVGNARDAQLAASNKVLGGQQDWLKQVGGMYDPYRQQGMQATNMLSALAANPNFWQGYGGFQSSMGNAMSGIANQTGGYNIQNPGGGGFNSSGQGGSGAGAFTSDGRGTGVMGGLPGGQEVGNQGPGFNSSRQGGAGAGAFTVDGRGMGVMGGLPGGQEVGSQGRGMGVMGGLPGGAEVGNQGPIGAMGPKPPEGSGGWVPQGMDAVNAAAMAAANGPTGRGRGNAQSQFGMPGSYTAQQIMNDPGYGFAKQEAMGSLDQRLASLGLSQSGAAIREAGELGGNIANRYYGDAYNRFSNDRTFAAGREDANRQAALQSAQLQLAQQGQAYNNAMQSAQLGLQSDAQRFGQGVQNRQMDWNQVLGDRSYDMDLRNQQLGLLGSLSGLGYNATNQYANTGTGINQGMWDTILGQGNTQAAAAMGKGANVGNAMTTMGNNAMQAGSNMGKSGK